jgi:hypothetical protein
MVERGKISYIAAKYGHYASWAVWANEGLKPKSNIGDLSIFDLAINPDISTILNPNIVMVGLNISRPIQFTFGNFHDSRSHSQDYKLRYAFRQTPFYGAYMTDIIKDFEQVISGEVNSFLKANRDFELQNVEMFTKELDDIGASDPLLIAFGNHSFSILDKHFGNEYKVVKVPHYSMQISKEDYKGRVSSLLLEYSATVK